MDDDHRTASRRTTSRARSAKTSSSAKLLYLGTEHGIYVSFDDGAKWESLRQNLPDTPVHDIAVEERDLVIATHGRGFYVMDNIAPLRQGGLQTTSTFHLYKPEDALRGLDRSVAVDYYLKQPAQKVTMEFIDPQGKVIRTFTGTPADAERKPPEPATTMEGSGVRRSRIRRSRPACSGSRGTCATRARPTFPA